MRKPLLLLLCSLMIVVTSCAARPHDGPRSPDAIGMHELTFTTEARTIPVGATLEFVNDGSRALHVLVPGSDARPRAQAGMPSFGGASGHRSEVGERWQTPPWQTPGTFLITCTLHPLMNLTVTVTPA